MCLLLGLPSQVQTFLKFDCSNLKKLKSDWNIIKKDKNKNKGLNNWEPWLLQLLNDILYVKFHVKTINPDLINFE